MINSICYTKNMKYKRKLISLLSIFILTSSCGVNTKNWPRFSFDFTSVDVEQISLYIAKKGNENIPISTDKWIVRESSQINKAIEFLIGIPYRENLEDKADVDDYIVKLEIVFSFYEYTMKDYEIVFFEYGVADCKVIFNNGDIHFLVADIEGIFSEIKGE